MVIYMKKIISLILLVCIISNVVISVGATEISYNSDSELSEGLEITTSRRGDDDEVREPPKYNMPNGGFVRYYLNSGSTEVQVLFLDRDGTRDFIAESNGNMNQSLGSVINTVVGNIGFDDPEKLFDSFGHFLDVISIGVAIQEGLIYADINDAGGYMMIETVSSVSTGKIISGPTVSGWHEHPDFQTPNNSTRWSCIFF